MSACAVSPIENATRVMAMRSRSDWRMLPPPNSASTTGWRTTAVSTAIGTIT